MAGTLDFVLGQAVADNANSATYAYQITVAVGDMIVIGALARKATPAPTIVSITDDAAGGIGAWGTINASMNAAFPSGTTTSRFICRQAIVATAGTWTVTVQWSATPTCGAGIIFKVPAGTFDAAAPFPTISVQDQNTGTACTVATPWGALSKPTNRRGFFVAHQMTSGQVTRESASWTELADVVASDGIGIAFYFTNSDTDDTSPSATLDNSAAWRLAGIEFANGGVVGAAGTGALGWTGFPPTADVSANVAPAPGLGQITVTGFAPTVSVSSGGSVAPAPGLGQVVLTGLAPAVSVTANVSPAPGLGQILVTGQAPSINAGGNQAPAPGLGQITVTGFAPAVSAGQNVAPAPGLGQLTVTGFAPTVSVSNNKVVLPGTAVLSWTGFAPTVGVTSNVVLATGTGAMLWTGYAPIVAGDPVVSTVTGKYKTEHDEALAALAAAHGFSAEHADALAALREAGI